MNELTLKNWQTNLETWLKRSHHLHTFEWEYLSLHFDTFSFLKEDDDSWKNTFEVSVQMGKYSLEKTKGFYLVDFFQSKAFLRSVIKKTSLGKKSPSLKIFVDSDIWLWKRFYRYPCGQEFQRKTCMKQIQISFVELRELFMTSTKICKICPKKANGL